MQKRVMLPVTGTASILRTTLFCQVTEAEAIPAHVFLGNYFSSLSDGLPKKDWTGS